MKSTCEKWYLGIPDKTHSRRIRIIMPEGVEKDKMRILLHEKTATLPIHIQLKRVSDDDSRFLIILIVSIVSLRAILICNPIFKTVFIISSLSTFVYVRARARLDMYV